VYSANSARSKPSSTASTLWRLALVPGDDWKAASAVATNRSLKASRKMIRSLENFFIIFFIWGLVCKRASDQCIFRLKKNY
jgi:hypothetical protein